ncbi:MAG: alpha/beta hydrolase [Synergistaceae bacterium]|jgi:acetyl esterase/lipase|nr:alpha/beta hydrolase [Synergistaceae bacterium]
MTKMPESIVQPDGSAWLGYEGGSEKNRRAGVIICPGGGYEIIAPREGMPVAREFERHSLRAFVLNYSLTPVPLGMRPVRELAWAVRTLRERSGELGFPGDKVVVCGFSAGGHIAASLGVHWKNRKIFPESPGDSLHRPDAMILAYPLITPGSLPPEGAGYIMAKLLDDSTSVDLFSLDKHVTSGAPPTFIWHTAADSLVPVRNSISFFEALNSEGIPAELHIYPRGDHALALAAKDPHIAGWLAQSVEWLKYPFIMGEDGNSIPPNGGV